MGKALALAAAAIAALAVTAGANATVIRETESVVGDLIPCEGGFTLTGVSGYLKIVVHEGSSASGNMNITGTVVPVGVTLVGSDGKTYHAAGAGWFGGAFNAQTGGETFTDTEHFVFVGPGGAVGKVITTFHVSPNANVVTVDLSSCTLPEEE